MKPAGRHIAIKDISTGYKEPPGKVWDFLGEHPGLRTDGHNVFLYYHESPAIMPADFGVEVVGTFTGEDSVTCVTTPAGEHGNQPGRSRRSGRVTRVRTKIASPSPSFVRVAEDPRQN